ncbi:MAG: hypothetical protein AAFO79_11685, partial [Pseudomonadota bacterium]
PRWNYGRRMATALELLDDPALDVLLTREVPLEQAPELLPGLIAGPDPELAITIRYPAAEAASPSSAPSPSPSPWQSWEDPT